MTNKKVSIFNFKIIIILLLGFGLAAFLSMRMLSITSEDVQQYRKLMMDTSSAESKNNAYTSQQKRYRVQKEIYFPKGMDRLHLCVKAAEAQLVLDHQESETAIIEHMKNVKCLMQEEVYYLLEDGREAVLQENGKLLIRHADPKEEASWLDSASSGLKPMQIIRYMQADTAAYYYKTDLFLADKVEMSRYIVPGHQLVDSVKGLNPVMHGIAQRIEFSLAGKDLNFKAHQFKATFFNSGKLR